MEHLRELIRTVAPSHATVLILGESGTGRELIAGAVQQSTFREDLFHRLNVAQFRPPPLRERGNDVPSGFGASSPLPILAMIPEAEDLAAEFPSTGALPA